MIKTPYICYSPDLFENPTYTSICDNYGLPNMCRHWVAPGAMGWLDREFRVCALPENSRLFPMTIKEIWSARYVD